MPRLQVLKHSKTKGLIAELVLAHAFNQLKALGNSPGQLQMTSALQARYMWVCWGTEFNQKLGKKHLSDLRTVIGAEGRIVNMLCGLQGKVWTDNTQMKVNAHQVCVGCLRKLLLVV